MTHDRVPMDPILIKRIVEAALLAANQPLTAVQLHALFPLDEPAPEGSIAPALESLQADCAGRGVGLAERASGRRYQVKEDVHPRVARRWAGPPRSGEPRGGKEGGRTCKIRGSA